MANLFSFIGTAYADSRILPYNSSCSDGGNCIATYLGTIADYLLAFVAALAVLFIIIGGLQLMTSRGNQTQTTRGKKTLTYAVIGLVLIILARVIFSLISNTLTGFFG